MGTCAALGGRMSSPELRESSARMLEVTGGRWPRNIPIPRAAGEDMFTSCLAHEMKIFPYGRNIAVVLSAVMDKDRQDATRKRRAFTRVGDPSHEVKRERGGAKSAAPSSSKLPLAVKTTVPRPSKSSSSARVVASGSSKSPSAEPTKERGPSSPLRVAEAAAGGAGLTMDICVDDYRVGGVMMFDAHTGQGLVGECLFFHTETGSWARLWCRVGCWATGYCPGSGGGRASCGGGRAEGCFAGLMVQLLRQRRDYVGHRR
jgi:hypothetical protein